MKYEKIYHLSHTDLDGYGSQYMTKFLGSVNDIEIIYFNAGYDQVTAKIKEVFSELLKNNVYSLFLITDLSLNEELAKKINNFKKGNKHLNFDVQVLDHHKTGMSVAEQNDWYLFDNDKCGASLTAEFVNGLHDNEDLKTHLVKIGNFIQAHDLWEKDNDCFGAANLLSDVIFNLYFPDFLDKRRFLFNYIFLFTDAFFVLKNVDDLEIAKPFILTEAINLSYSLSIEDKLFMADKNIGSLYKLYYIHAKMYSQIQDQFETLIINGFKCKVFFEVNSGFFQYFSHYYLENNSDMDFVFSIKKNGHASFRSVKEIDVGKIAESFGGGGHLHAAACKFANWENIHSYEEAVAFLRKV